jgi:hypothetical protein
VFVARWGIFVLWCFILWGTLWDVALLYTFIREGTAGVAAAVFEPPRVQPAAAWGNRLCGLLAALAWALLLLGRWSFPRRTA